MKYLNFKRYKFSTIFKNVNSIRYNFLKNLKSMNISRFEFGKIYRFNNIIKYNLIVNITNDGWYGKSSGPYQHLALAKIRAVQEGTFLLRTANTGVSAIINYNGEIVGKIDLGKKGILDKELVLIKKNTMYSKFGNSIFLSLIILLFSLLIILNINYKRVNKYE